MCGDPAFRCFVYLSAEGPTWSGVAFPTNPSIGQAVCVRPSEAKPLQLLDIFGESVNSPTNPSQCYEGELQITQSLCIAARSSYPHPISSKTSSVCSPSRGSFLRVFISTPPNLTGGAMVFSRPYAADVESSISSTISLASA
jgi:hypothetical protein